MRATASLGASLLLASLVAGGSGCAALWGFEDALDRADASAEIGSDATVEAGTGPSPRPDATTLGPNALDGAADATIDAPGPRGDAHDPDGDDKGDLDAAIVDASGPSDGASDAAMLEADSDCSGACVPSAPFGWEGPFEIYEGKSDPLPTCAPTVWTDTYDLVGAASGDPAECSCSCDSPAGAGCTSPIVSYFRDSRCTLPCAVNTAIGPACTPLLATGCGVTPHFQRGASTPEGGVCNPIVTATVPPATWGAEARLCAPAAGFMGVCAVGESCVPAQDPQFESSTYCVARAGDMPCPPGYPSSHTCLPGADAGGGAYYADASDGRGCTACTCGAAAEGTCGGAAILTYDDDACAAEAGAVVEDAGCIALTAAKASFDPPGPTGGGCAADGGEPTGALAPTNPYTICCNR